MENRYYTPDLEDLFIGYECEMRNFMQDSYSKFDISCWEDMEYNAYPYVDKLRTKYLDKEDIEKCGWTCQEYISNGYNQSYTRNEDSESGYDLIYCEAWGGKWQIDHCGGGIYWGEIKSINELRKIMKMIGIK